MLILLPGGGEKGGSRVAARERYGGAWPKGGEESLPQVVDLAAGLRYGRTQQFRRALDLALLLRIPGVLVVLAISAKLGGRPPSLLGYRHRHRKRATTSITFLDYPQVLVRRQHDSKGI